ncbi:putative transporter [compost metagenome]
MREGQHLQVIIIRMGNVPFMDLTGEANFSNVVKRLQRLGITVLITGIRPQPRRLLSKTGCLTKIGEDRFFEHTGDALDQALNIIHYDKCLSCRHFVFRECTKLSKGDAQHKSALQPNSSSALS